MEQVLQQLILVVEVVHLNDECVNFLDFMYHVQMLLCLDCVQDSLGLFAKFWQL